MSLHEAIWETLIDAAQHPLMCALFLLGGMAIGFCFFGMAMVDVRTSDLLAQMEKRT